MDASAWGFRFFFTTYLLVASETLNYGCVPSGSANSALDETVVCVVV